MIDVARPSRRIAVVEDNPDNRLLVQAILEELYQLTEYASGAEALVGLRQARPDLVLLDVSMPEMDGLDVIGAIRADDGLRGLPVIALTAHAMSGDRDRFLAAGFDGYVSKPIVSETVLTDAIEALLAPLGRRHPG